MEEEIKKLRVAMYLMWVSTVGSISETEQLWLRKYMQENEQIVAELIDFKLTLN